MQIIPSASGIKGKISEQLAPEAESAGKSFGGKMVGAIKGVVVAAGIGKAISASINEGAALQQSLGGVETLFKESADKVKANAAQAYKTAGVSANEYMEITTSFAASLLSSLGNDTAKAADMADVAMVDMADNANKMGTSMESIQMAYQGFAKQNYTMLDNLKLGYGGTKTEMERLLEDAQKITGIKYDINNLSDVYSAIHVIQGELGITGTTAKEAAETFSGSMAAMKAAAKNLIGNLSIGEDVGTPLMELGETVNTFFFGNLMPMIGNIVSSIPTLLEGTIKEIAGFASSLSEHVGEYMKGGASLVTGLIDGIMAGLPVLGESALQLVTTFGESLLMNGSAMIEGLATSVLEAIPQLMEMFGVGIEMLVGAITEFLPMLLEAGASLVLNLINGIVQSLPGIMKSAIELVNGFVTTITENGPAFIQTGLTAITNFVTGIIQSIPKLVASALELVTNFLATITNSLPQILQSGITLLLEFVNGIVQSFPSIISSATQAITEFSSEITKNLPTILNSGIEILLKLVNGIIDSLPEIISSAAEAISTFIGEIGKNLPDILEAGIEIIGALANGVLEAVPTLIGEIPGIVADICRAFLEVDWLSVGSNIIGGIASGVAGAAGQLWEAAKGALGSFKDNVLEFFGIHSPSRWGIWVGEMIDKGFAEGIEENLSPIKKSVSLMEGTVTKPFNSNIEYNGKINGKTNLSVEEVLYKILALLEIIASKDLKIGMYLNDREIGRALKEMGVVFE